MDNPGCFSLGDVPIGAPGEFLGDVASDLAGISALALSARLAYGGGGTSCAAFVQTSLDQGQTWFDLAAFAFTTAGGVQIASLVPASAPPFVPLDGALTVGTIQAGAPLGDRLRVKIVVAGTYTGSTLLSLWACAR